MPRPSRPTTVEICIAASVARQQIAATFEKRGLWERGGGEGNAGDGQEPRHPAVVAPSLPSFTLMMHGVAPPSGMSCAACGSNDVGTYKYRGIHGGRESGREGERFVSVDKASVVVIVQVP